MFHSLRLKVTRRFLIYLNLLLILFLLVPFLVSFKYLEKIFIEQVRNQALTIYHQIILTRKWIADHGGIFVEKLPWVEENPYLLQIGERTKIITVDNTILIKQNPALVTRQLSELARENNLYWFKITSLKYINPHNKPDALEEVALKSFEKDQSLEEFTKITKVNNRYFYRYIRPLYTEASCLRCHGKQGYKEGDIRGAISIFIPFDETYKKIVNYKILIILIFTIFWLSLNIMILSITNKFIFNPLYCIIKLLRTLKHLYNPLQEAKSDKKEPFFKNEWALLFESINQFLKEINYYQEQIEIKIKEATEELKKKTEQLQKLLENKKFLISNMAHEIKTPLTSIKGSIDFLHHYFIIKNSGNLQEKDREKLKEFIEISQKNISRLINLFNYLIDLEKHEADLLELEYKRINVKALLEDIVHSLKGLSEPKEITFKVSVDDNIELDADVEKLYIILSNLISNAIHHSPQRGVVSIRVSRKEKMVRFEIEDQGDGIKVDPNLLFEKFYKGRSNGFGLGLTIAKAYVEAHKGKIGAFNTEQGACFYFEIPEKLV